MKQLQQNKQGLISVVIPVYNAEKYIEECLDSVLGQTYTNLEIICVNDGSTDHSLSILESYAAKDSRIRVFSKKNEGKGAASARNLGLENATGEYVLFLDSDDFFDIRMVQKLVDRIQTDDTEVVIFEAYRYDEQAKKVVSKCKQIEVKYAPKKSAFSFRDCPDYIYQIGDLMTWNKIYKKELIDRYDLRFEEIAISDDQYIPLLALVLAERIAVLEEPLVYYRFNTGTSQCDSQHLHPEAGYLANFSIVQRLKELGIYKLVKKSYINMSVRLMREYFDHMRTYEAVEFLYHKYRKEVFPFLEADHLPEGYFYDEKLYAWYNMIMTTSLEEILFQASRAYGSKMTTGILRFQIPYEQIKRGSRIALVGKNLVGRYWYAQLLLSEYAEVVAWVSSEEELPKDLVCDAVLYAK